MPSFDGLAVLSLESRRSNEQATIISRLGGVPVVAPAMREVPLDSQVEAIAFIEAVRAHAFDVIVFLTGVGARALVAIADERGARDAFVAALSSVRTVVRGPKPLAVMRELDVPVWITAPEPNTWREVVAAIDAHASDYSVRGARLAVQEYGAANPELVAALTARGAVVTTVSIYQWALPEDVTPLRRAVDAVVSGAIDVVVLTSGVQLSHLWDVARDMQKDDALQAALAKTVIASIGPTCSEEIRRRGLEPDLEASHPKMGILVTEAAAKAGEILRKKKRH